MLLALLILAILVKTSSQRAKVVRVAGCPHEVALMPAINGEVNCLGNEFLRLLRKKFVR